MYDQTLYSGRVISSAVYVTKILSQFYFILCIINKNGDKSRPLKCMVSSKVYLSVVSSKVYLSVVLGKVFR